MYERNPSRYTRSWKCQVSVGELYRWILAKLSDKDIKRALHKYRDLMPRQSDWNRKLTQATNMPEVGFRYLYRCGQIDENNHRTMQKMLKYIDRQDVLPYFDTILYNTNNANCSIDELKKVLVDKVDTFLQYSTALSEGEVHPEGPYEINQCQPLENLRLTRSMAKRRNNDDPMRCVTIAKRARISSRNESPSSSTGFQSYTTDEVQSLAANCCGQVRSAIIAGALGGPAIHTLLSASLISMLTVLRMTLVQALSSGNSHGMLNSATNQNNSTSSYISQHGLSNIHGLSPSRLLAAMPHLLALARIHLPQNLTFGPGGPLPPPGIAPRVLGQPMIGSIGRGLGHLGGAAGFIVPTEGQHAPWPTRPVHNQQHYQQQQHAATASVLHQRHVVLFSGGVGITASSDDSCIFYYCRIRLRIRLDMGSSADMLNLIQVDRQDPYQRQLDMFAQASNLLRTRSPGEFVCDMRFNQLHHLESFWSDYLSGFLKQMLMDNLLSPNSRSFVGRHENQNNPSTTASSSIASDLPADASARWGDGGTQACTSSHHERPRYSGRASESREVLPPTEALATALRALRIRTNTAGYGCRGNQGDREASPDFDIHLFISRREYENGRALLMRNLRTIPSLCRLVAASNYLPVIAANSSSNYSSMPSTSSRL